jgi:hypothetical protein
MSSQEGIMMSYSQRRLAVAFGFAALVAAAPAAALIVGTGEQPAPRTVAECPGGPGISIGLNAVGAPFPTNCDLVVQPPAAIGGAPSAGAIIACRDVPGCLSNYVNGPGYVQVPHRDTTVRQSQ